MSAPAPTVTSPSPASNDLLSHMTTVDDFLCQQIPNSPKRKKRRTRYSGKSRRVISSSDDFVDDLEPPKLAHEDAYTDHQSSSPWSSPLPARRKKRSKPKPTIRQKQVPAKTIMKNKQPFSSRILRAATMSRVDQDTLGHWPQSWAVPLKMTSLSASTSPTVKVHDKRASLVSPYQRHECISTFDTPKRPESTKTCRPLSQLTRWNASRQALANMSQAPGSNSAKQDLHFRKSQPLSATPLKLTSFAEHVSGTSAKYPR